jgi:hypothetical protein
MIMLFASEEGIDLDYKVVDLFTANIRNPITPRSTPTAWFQRSMTAISG